MVSRWIRSWYGGILAPSLRGLQSLHVKPDALTAAGLLCELVAGLLLGFNRLAWGLGALLLGQVFDTLDGELARHSLAASPLGGFLDSVCDHYGDLAVYLGLLWHFLAQDAHLPAILIVLSLFGSVCGSHVRSRAGMAGVDTKQVGIFTRFERTLVIAAGILLNQLTIALGVLALLTNVSALQRVIYTLRTSRRSSDMAES